MKQCAQIIHSSLILAYVTLTVEVNNWYSFKWQIWNNMDFECIEMRK